MIRAYLRRPAMFALIGLGVLFALVLGLMLVGFAASAGSHGFDAEELVAIVCVVGFFGLLLGLAALSLLFQKKPIHERLTPFGTPNDLITAIDAELEDPNRVTVVGEPVTSWSVGGVRGRVLISHSWVIQFYPDYDVVPAPLDDVLWVCKVEHIRALGGRTRVWVRTRQGKDAGFLVHDADADRLVHELFRRLPWLVSGRDDRMEHFWKDNREGLIQAVQQQRERMRGLDQASLDAVVRDKAQRVLGDEPKAD